MPSHLTMEERDRLAQLRHQGANQKEIAQALARDKGTISRELRRNGTELNTSPDRLSGNASAAGVNARSFARWMLPHSTKRCV